MKQTYTFNLTDCSGNQEAELRGRRKLRAAGERASDFRMIECGPEMFGGRTSRTLYRVQFTRKAASELARR